ncbi:sugar ABC transporter substrate-binding protein [Duganella dendranthematis]|uniref:Sugar ABC transporter substrate-binding protein n=1 Tax=Duganella dendranthematis TaxID=2728021 RepID=A0ABX6M425_9BURK|nr:sugar ABC transporter substrate-binding protein [Duganella dendranthematis]QJD89045.1 sugar ABC transporter substrate-binding protein [Duganella dendranthematis]
MTRLVSIALLLSLVALLSSCSQRQEQGVVLKFWAMGREGEVVTALIPEFERTHPGVRVEVQQLPWTAAHEKLLTAFAGEVMPDVFQLGNTWIPELEVLNALAPLDGYVAASAVVRQDDYFPGIWDTNVVNGRLWGLPWYVDTRVMFYRQDMLKRAGFNTPPQTWAGWMKAMTAIKRMVGPDNYAILLPSDEFEPLLALALQQDEPLLRNGDRYGNFRSAGFQRSLQLYADMYAQKLAPLNRITNVYHEFGMGYVSFYISGPWNMGEFKRRLPAEQQDKWMTAILPGPAGPAASVAGGSSLVLAASSRHKTEAWQLIEYLSRTDSMARFNELTGDLPPRRSNWTLPKLAQDVYARAFAQQFERVRPTPKVPEWEQIATEMRLVAERVTHGELTVAQAAELLDAKADHILEKRRWMLARKEAR